MLSPWGVMGESVKIVVLGAKALKLLFVVLGAKAFRPYGEISFKRAEIIIQSECTVLISMPPSSTWDGIKKPPPAPVRAKRFRPRNAFAPDTTWDGSKKTPPVVVRAKCFRPGNAFALGCLGRKRLNCCLLYLGRKRLNCCTWGESVKIAVCCI